MLWLFGIPFLTFDYSIEELIQAREMTFPSLPAHSQSVERAVKLVSEASVAVCSKEARHTHILVKLMSRKARPNYQSKGSYAETYSDYFSPSKTDN